MKERIKELYHELYSEIPKGIELKYAAKEDLHDIAQIWFNTVAQDGRALKSDALDKRFCEYQERFSDPNHFFLLAKDETDKICGFIHYYIENNVNETKTGEERVGWIKTIGMNSQHQGTGLVISLIDKVIEDFKAKNIECIYIKLTKKRKGHLNFYESKGFKEFAIILKNKL